MNPSSLSDPLLPQSGSRIVIAGGCGGIGRALTQRAVALGLDVTVIDLPAAVAQHPNPAVTQYSADLTDEASVGDIFAKIAQSGPSIDGFVSLMGFSNEPDDIANISMAEFDAVMSGNLRSVQLCCRAAVPLLRASGSGSLVTVSSGQGVRPLKGFGPYAVAKAGLIALTRSLALENAPDMRANVVAPGAVRTAFLTGGTGRNQREGASVDEKADRYASTIPMGRIADPLDVADPILFLLSPASRFITGQVLHVNGGGLMP